MFTINPYLEVSMKNFLRLSSVLLCALMLFSCGKTPEVTTSATTPALTTTLDVQTQPVDFTLTLSYTPKSGNAKEVTGEGAVELAVSRAYQAGDKITVTLPEGQHYLVFCMADGVMEETILYLPSSKFIYNVQNSSMSYPSDLTCGKCTITARIPTAEELQQTRNLACNPADLETNKKAFPHATTSNVHNKGNETDRLHFEARNAIDGFTQNNGHGGFPVQSWGPGSNMSAKDNLKIDFGREVSLSKLCIFIRADFPHDTYWESCTVKFSDGSTMELNFTKTASGQEFALDNVKTSSITFTNFKKVAGSDWASWMEVQAFGADIVA